MLALSDDLARAGVSLRPATDADQPFLRALFASARLDAHVLAQWPPARREPFLDQQFHFQSVHFARANAGADFLVVEVDGAPAGRLILDRVTPIWSVVDIAFLPALRGRGLGEALLRWAQDWARRGGARAIKLHVEFGNPARRLYERLGFEEVADIYGSDTHAAMRWKVS